MRREAGSTSLQAGSTSLGHGTRELVHQTTCLNARNVGAPGRMKQAQQLFACTCDIPQHVDERATREHSTQRWPFSLLIARLHALDQSYTSNLSGGGQRGSAMRRQRLAAT